MGYAVYTDRDARDSGVLRWAGYGVPAECDWPSCHKRIDRGLGYKCEEHEMYDEEVEDEMMEDGCGLYFCSDHINEVEEHKDIFPKPDILEWRRWQLYAPSWGQWREENPAELPKIISELNNGASEEKERILLLSITMEEEFPVIGNSLILGKDQEQDIPKYEAAGWVVAETHMPAFEDPQTEMLLAIVKDQWEELLEDE